MIIHTTYNSEFIIYYVNYTVLCDLGKDIKLNARVLDDIFCYNMRILVCVKFNFALCIQIAMFAYLQQKGNSSHKA